MLSLIKKLINIIRFDFFIVEKKLVVISPILRKNIEEDLKSNGRFHTSSILIKNKRSSASSEIVDRLIKKYRFVDIDYYKLIEKYSEPWVGHLLTSKGWKQTNTDQYLSDLCTYFNG